MKLNASKASKLLGLSCGF